jgi:Tol biopolymer transport system component
VTEYRSVLERAGESAPSPDLPLERVLQRRDRRHRDQRIRAAVLGIAIAIAVGWVGVNAIRSTPQPADDRSEELGILRANGEVLDFTGHSFDVPGDLVTLNPETGEERVLVEDLEHVYSANWSADGRWVAYASMQPGSANGVVELWVVGSSLAPHRIATYGNGDLFAAGSMGWVWSRTGAKLLTADLSSTDDNGQSIERSALAVTDFTTGETTDLGSIEGYAGYSPAWSPDGTRIALKTGNGSLYSVDLGSGERSLLAHFTENDHDQGSSIESIQWSPDGTHLSVVTSLGDGGQRLYVMDADGSNVRVLSEGHELLLEAWSPDGTRLAFAEGSQAEGDVRVLVAPTDGSDPAEIGIIPFVGCTYHYKCGITWSPDGSTIGIAKDKGVDYALAADGSVEAEPLDDLTYRSWASGCTECGYQPGT